jgi:hypothetical protein
MWNSGMILSPRSEAVSAKVCRTLRAEALTLRWASGTIFGREVVPDVCRTSAMSSAVAGPWRGGSDAACPLANTSVKLPAPRSCVVATRAIGTPSLLATSMAGDALSCSTISSLAFKSVR